MAPWNELTWDKAMQRAYEAVSLSERLYEEIDAEEGRSNVDIEKHLRRVEVKAAHARTWVAIAQALGTQGDRYEGV
jgi:predicted transcriptional regulator